MTLRRLAHGVIFGQAWRNMPPERTARIGAKRRFFGGPIDTLNQAIGGGRGPDATKDHRENKEPFPMLADARHFVFVSFQRIHWPGADINGPDYISFSFVSYVI